MPKSVGRNADLASKLSAIKAIGAAVLNYKHAHGLTLRKLEEMWGITRSELSLLMSKKDHHKIGRLAMKTRVRLKSLESASDEIKKLVQQYEDLQK
jgi:predicted XRE-type DNA-binding protein